MSLTKQIISTELIELCYNTAIEAGKAILEVYESAFSVEHKDDKSPLTLADKKAHEVIAAALKNSGFPVLSEEGKEIAFDERKSWETYWCVDPLDGTKEFINRNGEFTVNIALIHQNETIYGIVYAPVTDTAYVGIVGEEAYKVVNGVKTTLKVNNKASQRIAVQSKSHAAEEETALLEKYDVTDTVSVGSSLKFCMIAEGKADIYYRHGPTMEWDTAAGQAVVVAAGGKVFDAESNIFKYNKENLRNGSFLCLGF